MGNQQSTGNVTVSQGYSNYDAKQIYARNNRNVEPDKVVVRHLHNKDALEFGEREYRRRKERGDRRVVFVTGRGNLSDGPPVLKYTILKIFDDTDKVETDCPNDGCITVYFNARGDKQARRTHEPGSWKQSQGVVIEEEETDYTSLAMGAAGIVAAAGLAAWGMHWFARKNTERE